MKLVNLTPHEINIYNEDDSITTIPPEEVCARVSVSSSVVGHIGSTRLYEALYGDVVGLPNPCADTIYIVSVMVAQRVPNRDDVFYLAEFIRDDKNQIIGAKGIQHI